MTLLPKRLLLVGAAPLAIAAVYGGSVAFAQSGEPTPTPSTDGGSAPTAPADPTAPRHTPGDSADCPNMGGSSDSSDSSGGTSTQTRFRQARGMAPNAYAQ